MQEAKETPLNSPSPSPALTPLSNARLNWYVEAYARDESISGRELYRAFVELRQLREAKTWRPGDEKARDGSLIVAEFEWVYRPTGYVGKQYAIIRWDDDAHHWVDYEGDCFTETDDLPNRYRPFGPPSSDR